MNTETKHTPTDLMAVYNRIEKNLNQYGAFDYGYQSYEDLSDIKRACNSHERLNRVADAAIQKLQEIIDLYGLENEEKANLIETRKRWINILETGEV
jgi:hypothetical protein